MSLDAVVFLGVGIAWRAFINVYFGQSDEKAAGALLGLWDGIASQRTWRSGRSPEPLALVESIGGLLFDVFYHASLVRTASLVLGAVLGVLLADVLPALWEEVGGPAAQTLSNLNNVKFVDDFDSSVILSEVSDGVTLIYEEYSTAFSTTAWIAAQRKRKAGTSTSRRRSATATIQDSTTRRSKATTLSSRVESIRSERVKEKAESDAPAPVPAPVAIPPPSVISSFNIDIQPPSAASFRSTPPPTTIPTIRTDFIEGLGAISGRPSTRGQSLASTRSNASGSTLKDHKSTIRDAGATEILVSPADVGPRPRAFSRSHSRGRSLASTRREGQPRVEVARSYVNSESSTPRMAESIGHTLSATPRRSVPSHAPASPKPEVVIDYTQDATKIIIPPGVNENVSFRVVNHEDAGQPPGAPGRSRAGSTNGPSDFEPVPPQSYKLHPASVRATPIAQVLNLTPSVAAPRSYAGRGRSPSSRYSQTDVNGLLLNVDGPGKAPSMSARGARSARSRSHSAKRTPAASVHTRAPSHVHEEFNANTPRLSPARLRHAAMQGPPPIPSPTVDESVVSLGHDEDLYEQAERLRRQAREVEVSLKSMREQRQEAHIAGQRAQEIALDYEIKDVEGLVQKLHRKADRSMQLANNVLPLRIARVNVADVQVLEAVRRVEKALHTVQQGGGRELQVVLSQGGINSASSTVVKSTIMDKMSKKYHLQVKEDKMDPGLLHVYVS